MSVPPSTSGPVTELVARVTRLLVDEHTAHVHRLVAAMHAEGLSDEVVARVLDRATPPARDYGVVTDRDDGEGWVARSARRARESFRRPV